LVFIYVIFFSCVFYLTLPFSKDCYDNRPWKPHKKKKVLIILFHDPLKTIKKIISSLLHATLSRLFDRKRDIAWTCDKVLQVLNILLLLFKLTYFIRWDYMVSAATLFAKIDEPGWTRVANFTNTHAIILSEILRQTMATTNLM